MTAAAPWLPVKGEPIEEAGIYEMPAARYHADPVAVPSLSASVARIMTMQTARHGQHAHPRFRPDYQPKESTEAQREGEALHSLILDREDRLRVLRFPDYKTKKAQEAHALALFDGLIPVKHERAVELRHAAAAVRAQLDAHPEDSDAFTDGKPERVLVWPEETQYGRIWCRSRVDWIGRRWLDDLKSVDGQHGAHPEEWSASMRREGRLVQSPFYLRGARALGLNPQGFRWIIFERSAPFALSTVSLDPELTEYAEKQVEAALDMWGRGIHTGEWPGYPPRRWHAELPSFMREKAGAFAAAKKIAAEMEKPRRERRRPGGDSVADRSMPWA
jgi:hypothetical protein